MRTFFYVLACLSYIAAMVLALVFSAWAFSSVMFVVSLVFVCIGAREDD